MRTCLCMAAIALLLIGCSSDGQPIAQENPPEAGELTPGTDGRGDQAAPDADVRRDADTRDGADLADSSGPLDGQSTTELLDNQGGEPDADMDPGDGQDLPDLPEHIDGGILWDGTPEFDTYDLLPLDTETLSVEIMALDQTGDDGSDTSLPPDLQLAVEQLTFVGIVGGWVSEPIVVQPQNGGGGDLEWMVETDAAWLAVEPAVGTAGESFTVSVVGEELPAEAGTMEALLLVASASDEADVEELTVTVETVTTAAGPFTTQFEYDDIDRLTAVTFPDGGQTNFGYADWAQPVEATWPDGTTLTWEYDEAGRIVGMSDQSGDMDWLWNKWAQLEEVIYPDGASFGYGYDAGGRLTELTYPDGTIVTYAYGPDGLLESITSPTGQFLFERNDSGAIAQKVFPGGVTSSYEYDVSGLLAAAETLSAEGQFIVRFEQEVNELGLRSALIETTPDGTMTWDFSYDPAGRLETVMGPSGTTQYTYDAAGRRILEEGPETDTVYAYDDDGRMIRAGNRVFRYDARGQMTESISPDGKTGYIHDGRGHLVSVEGPEIEVDYGIAPDDTRYSRTTPDGTEKLYQTALQGQPRIVYREPAGNPACRFIYGPGWLAEECADQETRVIIEDLLGSVARVLSPGGGGEIETVQRFSPFGERISGDYPIGYRGEEQDPATGLIHLRAREYDPSLGIFYSKDIARPQSSDPDTLDPYRYALADPVNHTDPDGQAPKMDDIMETVGKELEKIAKQLEMAKKHNLAIVGVIQIEVNGGVEWDVEDGWDGAIQIEDGIFQIPLVLMEQGKELAGEAKWLNKWPFSAFAGGAKTPFTQKKDFSLPIDYKSEDGKLKLEGQFDLKISVVGKIFMTKTLDKKLWGNQGYLVGEPPKGGVSLNEAATVVGDLGDIDGAAWDPNSGQLVLYGPDNHLFLPPMSPDDLVAAYRSVFLHAGEDPGVTMGNVPPPEGFEEEQGVAYYGGVEETHLGWTLFEADRQLKCYTLGADNVTGESVDSQVAGYQSILASTVQAEELPDEVDHRMWFVPGEVELAISSEDEEAIVFTSATIDVVTESKISGEPLDNPIAETFAAHLTENFDLYAAEQPIWAELRRVMKIVSVLQWIRDEGLPLDTAWFEQYDLPAVETPLHTPTIMVSDQTEGGQVVSVTGGVDLTVTNQYDPAASAAAAELAGAALAARPDEETSSWTLEAQEGEELRAVAFDAARVARAGYRYLAQRDGHHPCPGDVPLELVRYCSPFDVGPTPFGHCWVPSPQSLLRTGANKLIAWPGKPGGRVVPDRVTWRSRKAARDIDFAYSGKQGDDLVYEPAEANHGLLLLGADDTWTLELPEGRTLAFTTDFHLDWEEDRSGNRVSYLRDESGMLNTIEHTCGSQISLTYDQFQRVDGAIMPGGTAVTYSYDGEGNLAAVQKGDLPALSFAYDSNHVPLHTDGLAAGPDIETGFDFLGRVVSVEVTEAEKYDISYTDFGHSVTIADPQGGETLHTFDHRMRPASVTDPLGRTTSLEYEGEGGPTGLVDPLGRTTSMAYDDLGRIVELAKPDGRTRKVYYETEGKLPTALSRTGLPDLYLERDEEGRVVKVYDQAKLIVEGGALVGVATNGPAAELSYDAAGGLSGVVHPDGTSWSVTRDESGNPLVIDFPSGRQEFRSYDEQGRLAELERSDGSYVALDYHPTGHVKSISTPAGTHQMEVGPTGLVTAITDPSGAVTEYLWDDTGRLAGILQADGSGVSYDRDNLGNVVTATDTTGWGIELVRDAAGRTTAITTGHME